MTTQNKQGMIAMANKGLQKPYCTVPAVRLSYDGNDRNEATTIRHKNFLKYKVLVFSHVIIDTEGEV